MVPVLKSNVWLKDGMLMTFGSAVDTQQHQHHAIQLVWSTTHCQCYCGKDVFSGCVIIGSQVQHKLVLDEGWVVLIEPASEVGRYLTDKLSGQNVIEIEQQLLNITLPQLRDSSLAGSHLDELFLALGMPSGPRSCISTSSDERIQLLISRLDLCFSGECQKPANWRAEVIARELSLSESRFRHLFRQQMGIAWRPYLRWRRLACAIRAMISGQSATQATQAAHSAGFSDSAHLSRTFRNMFGFSIQQARQFFFTK